MKRIRNLKLVILLEYQNIKYFSKRLHTKLKTSEDAFVIKKVKNTVPWTYVINDLIWHEIVGIFYKKELQKHIKKNLELKK